MRGVSIATTICSKPLILILAQLRLAVFFWSFDMAYYGFVYVMANEAMPDFFKIGFTDKAPSQRAAELSNTSVPFNFQLVCYGEVDNAQNFERKLHEIYSENRVNTQREFFKFSASEVLKLCNVIKEHCDFFTTGEIYNFIEYQISKKDI